jgi:hypothetical protein
VSASDALVRPASNVERLPILIVSDINMSGMTGLEILPKRKKCGLTFRHHITAHGDGIRARPLVGDNFGGGPMRESHLSQRG